MRTYNSTGTVKLCTVSAVDIVRKVCKCVSDQGEVLSEVRWVVPMGGSDGTGLSVHPIENSRALVDTASGFPFIIGAIPQDSLSKVKRTNVGRQSVNEEDITNYSTVDVGDIIRGPGTPLDQRVGDNLITADGGGLIGLLSSGTAVIKSSPWAQIIFSRFGDLCRLVTRNFEHFTDVDETYKVSARGKVYTLRNLFRTTSKSRVEEPSLVRYEGDVAFGETIGKAYAQTVKDEFPTAAGIPEDADKIVKEYTLNDDNQKTSTMTQSIEGALHRTINLPDGSSTSVQDEDSSELKKSVTGGDATNWHMNETEFHWDVDHGKVFVTGNKDCIIINTAGAAVVTINSDGTIDIKNDSTLTVTSGGDMTFNAPGVTFNADNNFVVNATNSMTTCSNIFMATAPGISIG